MEDIQSWWEVPSIAYFCSLFRTAFNLLDFDIEELEEALLTDGTEESASSLLTELIVRLLNGCLGNNDISAFNYQMYLRRLFRRKCQETGRYNQFNTDIDFQFLPLRTKVEILYALCDFRLEAEDVFDLFKNLEAESLRVEPLGWDDNSSAYWYFYGTRLYREDVIKKQKGKNKKKKSKESKKRGWFYGDDWLDDDDTDRVWQVVCFTEDDWSHLTEKFSKASSKVEKELYRSLSQNFLPEIPRLFQEKERLQRKRLLELLPRRTSSRVLQKIKQKEEEDKHSPHEIKEEEEDDSKDTPDLARENRAKRRNLIRTKSESSDSSENTASETEEMPQKVSKRPKSQDKRSKNSPATQKGEPPPEPPIKTGRKTNNSLASATGQILIPENVPEPVNSTRKKLKTSQIFSQMEEDVQTDMYKVLEQLSAHEDAWPFMDPVDEKFAPNYYAVIRRPMDLKKMEERLDSGYYTDFSMFKADFKLIVNNCRLFNGQDNEYTMMVDNLQAAFDRLTEKYIHRLSSSDEEIAVEYQLPTPSRKHKLKTSESPTRHKRKKRKSHSDTGEPKSSSSDQIPEKQDDDGEPTSSVVKKSKESHKNKDGKGKKKRKGHRHGKHSKNHKKDSHKSGHGESKKQKKHSKNKDKDGKKSKKKKSKHPESDTEEVIKRAPSQESLESSNRSRSASPLPSIHTPSPSPTELDQSDPPDQLSDPDFFKDKYDKIKERRRHAAKDAWDSLFDYKQKAADKQNIHIPEKDKNQKLRETIEKLKAKNEKYKDSSPFNNLFTPGQSKIDKRLETKNDKDSDNKNGDNNDFSDDDVSDSPKSKVASKKNNKKNTAKNESASEALEQAVKDISKWLDDAPKGSAVSSPCDSPAQTISTEEHDNSRLDDEFSQGEKSMFMRKETRKRPSSREPKMVKRREIQRTIDRLQPGKGKGNLLTNISNKNAEKQEEVAPLGSLNKVRDINKTEESSPKLSLGSVLPTVEFALGNDHNFADDNKAEEQKDNNTVPEGEKADEKEDSTPDKKSEETKEVPCSKKDAEVETESPITTKPSQEKATPNLSAWFKAFGAPKSSTSTSTTAVKKKVEDTTEAEEKVADNTNNDNKSSSPKNVTKYDSPIDPETPNPDGGDSPLPNTIATPRQRRTSTGSSVSERSSFSQDLDSPRHQMSHTSPLLQSPASPRTDDFQKITYPIINGTVRAGFYQDTTSIKSSPEKSCSPREAPQSPYSPYSQHVYASNSVMGSTTPNYFVDHNKSPLPTYSHNNPPPYYDTTKIPVANKPTGPHGDYTALGPDSFQQPQYGGSFSPAHTAYPQTSSSNYSQSQPSPQPATSNQGPSVNTSQILPEPKTSLFPVKKRAYNEPDIPNVTSKKIADSKEAAGVAPIKNDYQKITQSLHSMTPSVDDIALALSEKSELAKLNSLREKSAMDYLERRSVENRDNNFENPDTIHDGKKDTSNFDSTKPIGITNKDNVDMVNMGYMNPECDRRSSADIDFSLARDVSKAALNQHQKGYEVEAIAINLGLNSQQLQKSMAAKMNMNPNNIPPAHSHDRSEIINQTLVHAHHNQYDTLSSGQSISNFSLNDIELANKKLYSCNTTSSAGAIDYGNWKMGSQTRKQDMLPPEYPTNYSSTSTDKLKSDLSSASANVIHYNKNIQNQQYSNYTAPQRSNIQRTQELQQNLPAELRIPNPRGLLKNDHLSVSSSISDSELIAKNIDTLAKSQKSEKLVQNHPLVNSIPYKVPYSAHSTLPLDSLRNLPKIPQMLERYTNEERYLSSFASSSASSLYHDKTFQMAQMFNKSIPSDVHPASTSVSIYSQPSVVMSKDSSIHKSSSISSTSADKTKTKRKRTTDTAKQSQIVGNQAYHTSPCATDVLSSVKSSMMPSSAFNFGASANMGLGTGLYGDNGGFSIEDFRNTNLMAANYMAAAVAHQQQRNNSEASAEKLVKPAHQNTSHAASSFPFLGHSQVRGGYGYVGGDGSPLYQQYLQRHQEELFRQTGAQIMGLYPPGYPAGLGVRQPYDAINRPSWL